MNFNLTQLPGTRDKQVYGLNHIFDALIITMEAEQEGLVGPSRLAKVYPAEQVACVCDAESKWQRALA